MLKTKYNLNSSGARIWLFSLSFMVIAVVALIWFLPFDFHAIMGDDLAAILSSHTGGFGSSFLQAFTHAPTNKYRPFFEIAFRAETLLLGKDLRQYIYLNICLEVLNACLLFFICWRVSGRKYFVALVGALLFTISRFSYYNIIQIFGASLEGLGLFFLLLVLCLIVLAYEAKNKGYLVAAVLVYLCLTLTHERYLAASVFMALALFWAPVSFRRTYHRYLLAATPFVIFSLNIILKKLVFNARFMEGTAGTAVTFQPGQFCLFVFKGWLNMFGFNAGPAYLSGLDVLDAGFIGIALGAVFSITIIGVVYFFYRSVTSEEHSEAALVKKIVALLLLLAMSLIAVASITIRQEYRWLYAPYTVLITLCCYCLGNLKSERVRAVLLVVLLLSAYSTELFYRQFLGKFYLVAALKAVQSAKTVIVDNAMNLYPDRQIFIFKPRELKWAFQDDYFFKYYSGRSVKVNYIDNPSEIPVAALYKGEVGVYSFGPNREIFDITDDAKKFLANAK